MNLVDTWQGDLVTRHSVRETDEFIDVDSSSLGIDE
jgi:hypothetical protein